MGMIDSIEIYSNIRAWEDLRRIEIDRMRKRQFASVNGDLIIAEDEVEIMNKRKMKELEAAFLEESTDVEYIVTHTFPDLRKSAWLYTYFIEENKIESEGYQYKTFEGKCAPEHQRETYNTLEEAVSGILLATNSQTSIDNAIKGFYYWK
ncbi:MAG TPA: hypothetical protein VGN02_06230 [Paenibacillus sp.]|jgi:hypothetical protein